MNQEQRIDRATNAVKQWVQQTMGWRPERVSISHIPQLSTPHFDFFTLQQRGMSVAGELYVMTDGQEVLPSNRANFAKVLVHEGFLQHPDVIPAQQFAELFFKMAEVRQVHVITGQQDQALKGLDKVTMASFAPPTVQREGDGVVAAFWTSALKPTQVERWEVRTGADGEVSHTSEQVT